MTCAQGLLRLLWGGAEVGVLRDWVFVNVFCSPNGFRQFGRVTFVTIFKALIMVVEAGFELRLATATIMPCNAS